MEEIEIEVCGHKIKCNSYSLAMLLDEFCFYLSEEGIKNLGKEIPDMGFVISDQCTEAIKKILKDKGIKPK